MTDEALWRLSESRREGRSIEEVSIELEAELGAEFAVGFARRRSGLTETAMKALWLPRKKRTAFGASRACRRTREG